MTADRAIKEPCRVATTADITTLSDLLTIDGVAVGAGDRVLVKNQSNAVQNGIYDAATGSWTRSADFDAAGEVVGGTEVLVTSGSTQAGNFYRVAGAGAITPNSNAISFELAIEADAVSFLQAGTGAVNRTAQAKLREQWVSVKDFGATGGGATDDTAEINAAVAALDPGQTLYFPDGTYLVSVSDGVEKAIAPIPVGCNVFMEGGALLTTNLAKTEVEGSGIMTFLTPLGNNVLQVNIDGNGYPNSGPNAGTVRGTWRNIVTGIRCHYNPEFGLGAESVTVINSNIRNCRYCIRADGSKNWKVVDSRFSGTEYSAILFGYWLTQDCLHNIVAGCSFEDHGDTAVAFFQVSGMPTFGYCRYNIVANCVARNTNLLASGFAFDVEVGNPDYQQDISFVNLVVEQEEICGATLQRGVVTMGGVRNALVLGVNARSYSKPAEDMAINMSRCIGGLIDDYVLRDFGGPAIGTDGSDGVVVGGNGTIIDCCGAAGYTPAIRGSIAFDTRNITINVPNIVTTTNREFRASEPAVAFLAIVGEAPEYKRIRIDNIRILGGTAENPMDIGIAVEGDENLRARNVEISGVSLLGISGATDYFNSAGIQCRYIDNLKITNIQLDPQAGALERGIYARNCAEVSVDGLDVLGGTVSYLFDFYQSTGVRVDNQRTWSGAAVTNLTWNVGGQDGNGTLTRWGEHIDAYPLPNAANDGAAAALSPPIPVGAPYRNGSVRMVRVS